MISRNDTLGTGVAAGTTVGATTQATIPEELKPDLLSVVLNIPFIDFSITVGGAIILFGAAATACFLVRSFYKDKD